MTYSELQATSNFCFLRGASSPEELFTTAALMGMPALGVVDRNSVAGLVRSLIAAEQVSAQHAPIRLVMAVGSTSSPARPCWCGWKIARPGRD